MISIITYQINSDDIKKDKNEIKTEELQLNTTSYYRNNHRFTSRKD